MKLAIAVLVTVLVLVTSTAGVLARSFDEVPGDHWIYQAVADLVKAQLADYPAEYAGDIRLSRYEAAMLVANVLESNMETDLAKRAVKQTAMLTAAIESEAARGLVGVAEVKRFFDRMSLGEPLMAEDLAQVLLALPAQSRLQLAEEIFLGETAVQQNAGIVSAIVALIAELEQEIHALGVELTFVEKAVLPFIVYDPETTVLEVTDSFRHRPAHNDRLLGLSLQRPPISSTDNHEHSLTTGYRNLGSAEDNLTTQLKLEVLSSLETGELEQLAGEEYGNSEQSGLFANYRFIDFSDFLVHPSSKPRSLKE